LKQSRWGATKQQGAFAIKNKKNKRKFVNFSARLSEKKVVNVIRHVWRVAN
jgi:hypothetical protein